MEEHSRRWSCRPLGRAYERENGGCRVVVRGGSCFGKDCWRGKSGRERREARKTEHVSGEKRGRAL